MANRHQAEGQRLDSRGGWPHGRVENQEIFRGKKKNGGLRKGEKAEN